MSMMTSLGEWNPSGDYECHCKDGECSNCGECCSDFLPLTEVEVNRIKKYIKTHQIKPHKNVAPAAHEFYDFTCPFRNNAEHKCDIYEVRPGICRHYLCTMAPHEVRNDPGLLTVQRTDISMRETFFEDTTNVSVVNSAAFRLAMAAKEMMR